MVHKNLKDFFITSVGNIRAVWVCWGVSRATPKFSQTSTFRLPAETQHYYCTVRTVEPLIEPALAVIVDFPAANARATP